MELKDDVSSTITIERSTTVSDLACVRTLLREYAGSPDWEPGFAAYLAQQAFDKEVEELPDVYGPPHGTLLLARINGQPMGCIAIKPYELPDVCEMKRLFVRPGGRGTGLGKALVLAIMDAARVSGYKKIRLDTLPSMAAAQKLYRSLGYVEIPPYCDNPVHGSSFFERSL